MIVCLVGAFALPIYLNMQSPPLISVAAALITIPVLLVTFFLVFRFLPNRRLKEVEHLYQLLNNLKSREEVQNALSTPIEIVESRLTSIAGIAIGCILMIGAVFLPSADAPWSSYPVFALLIGAACVVGGILTTFLGKPQIIITRDGISGKRITDQIPWKRIRSITAVYKRLELADAKDAVTLDFRSMGITLLHLIIKRTVKAPVGLDILHVDRVRKWQIDIERLAVEPIHVYRLVMVVATKLADEQQLNLDQELADVETIRSPQEFLRELEDKDHDAE